jgi:putative ABC transport system permease protein
MISPAATLVIALRALARNKLRSFLTSLGIIIGVAAVIAMVAIGEGAKARVEQSLAAMGTNLLVIRSGASQGGGVRGGFGSQPTLTWDDMKAIQSELPTVQYAAPLLRTQAEVVADGGNWTTTIYGTTPDYFQIRNWAVETGTGITASDVSGSSKVVLLGSSVAERLFGLASDPVGSTVRIRNAPYVVIGVLAKKGQSGIGQDYDDSAYVPVQTFQTRVQGGLSKFIDGQLFIGTASSADTTQAETDIAELLRDRHRLAATAEDDFNIRNLAELASARAESTQTMTTLLAGIALVSLIVGGIGVMNIMLVSVTERTREIGVRIAIGARPSDILAQFLVEALALSVVGGLAGVAVGVLSAQLLAKQFDWPLTIRLDIVLTATLVSGIVGIVFGLYPARKAARLNPIDALRYE